MDNKYNRLNYLFYMISPILETLLCPFSIGLWRTQMQNFVYMCICKNNEKNCI